MFDVIANLIDKFLVLVLLGFGLATGAGMLFAYLKTRSAPAVLGMAALGISAMVLVANMTTVANLFGADVLGDDRVTVDQVTGRSGPSPTTTNPGGSTGTTVCTEQQSEAGVC